MNETELIGERIRRFAFAFDDADWLDVLERAGMSETRSHRVRARWLVPAIAVAILLGGGATYAAVRGVPWWQTGAPPVDPQAVVQLARDNLPANIDTADARTVEEVGNAALVAVPLDRTGYCLIPALDGRGDLGGQCEYQVRNPRSGDDDILRAYAQPSSRPGGPAWLVYGRVTDPRAAAIDLSDAAGYPLELTLAPGGFFLTTIAPDHWRHLAGTAGAGQILDAAGSALRRGCIAWGPSPNSAAAGESDTILWGATGGQCKAPPRPAPQPPLTGADLSKAHALVAITLASRWSIFQAGTRIALWEAPGAGGSDCVFEAKADAPPHDSVGGGACYPTGAQRATAARPIYLSLGATRLPNGDYSEVAQGSVDPALGIVKLELRGAATALPVAFAHDWFLVELPDSSSVRLPAGGPWALIGYDASGKQVARASLTSLETSASPH